MDKAYFNIIDRNFSMKALDSGHIFIGGKNTVRQIQSNTMKKLRLEDFSILTQLVAMRGTDFWTVWSFWIDDDNAFRNQMGLAHIKRDL